MISEDLYVGSLELCLPNEVSYRDERYAPPRTIVVLRHVPCGLVEEPDIFGVVV